MTDSSRSAKIALTELNFDSARDYGVKGGSIPISAEAGDEAVLKLALLDRWCAPLVVASAVEVFDFTEGYDPNRKLTCAYGIGRYFEDRVGMYETALFKSVSEPRTVHVGLDIGAAEGTPIFAPTSGRVFGAGYLAADGDYGGTVILKTDTAPHAAGLYMLFGHLSRATARRWAAGDVVKAGELIGWLGAKIENGGWNPHLHWQLSWLEPLVIDLPGAVSKSKRPLARQIFPDPTPLLRASIAGWS